MVIRIAKIRNDNIGGGHLAPQKWYENLYEISCDGKDSVRLTGRRFRIRGFQKWSTKSAVHQWFRQILDFRHKWCLDGSGSAKQYVCLQWPMIAKTTHFAGFFFFTTDSVGKPIANLEYLDFYLLLSNSVGALPMDTACEIRADKQTYGNRKCPGSHS